MKKKKKILKFENSMKCFLVRQGIVLKLTNSAPTNLKRNTILSTVLLLAHERINSFRAYD